MLYPLVVWGQFNAHVAIYARDGTVSIAHGGIECGQGINTKVRVRESNKIDKMYVDEKQISSLSL